MLTTSPRVCRSLAALVLLAVLAFTTTSAEAGGHRNFGGHSGFKGNFGHKNFGQKNFNHNFKFHNFNRNHNFFRGHNVHQNFLFKKHNPVFVPVFTPVKKFHW